MTTIIPSLRQEIETRLGELQAESDKLRNALGALKDNGVGTERAAYKPRIWATTGTGTFSEASVRTSKKPKASAAKAEKTERTERIERKPRKSVQAAVLAELERIAPERASAKGLADKLDLNRNVVSTTLSKLAKDGAIEAPPQTGAGYAVKTQADAPEAA